MSVMRTASRKSDTLDELLDDAVLSSTAAKGASDAAHAARRKRGLAQRWRERGLLVLPDGRVYRKRVKAPKPGPRAPKWNGWQLPGGGQTVRMDAPPEWRGPATQVAGLFPFSVGSSLPMVGTPLGDHLGQRGIVCGDPISWFAHGLINNPSGFVLGRPGLGKSSLVCRMVIAAMWRGIIPIVPADYKGEYVELITALGGPECVVRPQRGVSYVNPLDRGPLWALLEQMAPEVRAAAEADINARRANVLYGLAELALGRELETHERNVLGAALRLADQNSPEKAPVMEDLLSLVQSRPEQLAMLLNDRGDKNRYFARVEGVLDALVALGPNGEFGDTFSRQTSVKFEMHKPLCFDLSWVEAQDTRLQAGLQLVLWSYSSAAVASAKFAAEAGLGPSRSYLLIFDELWRSLKGAPFMVYRVDEITRLNRTLNLGQLLITHTMDDLTLHSEEATAVARGFVERSEMVWMGGLAPGEMGNLARVFKLSEREQAMLSSWSPPGKVNPATGVVEPPAGRGKFLMKVGQQVGVPLQTRLTQAELAIHDTNVNWRDTIRSFTGASAA